MKFLKRYIGDKNFYKTALTVALPIMLQNGITNFVNLLDNIMVGQVGTEQMSGVAIVNQLLFVFNLAIFGMVSGAGIFTAQFHGNKNDEGVTKTFRFKFLISLLLFAIAICVLALFNEQLIGLYLNEGSAEGDLALTLGYGKDYLWIMLIGLLPYTISQVYGSTLRETENTMLPMIAGFVAVGVNCLGNYILIFGKLGAPVMGVQGAAIATVASRFVEMLILVFAVWVKRNKYTFIKGAFRHLFSIDKALIINILKKGMPLLLNETLWSTALSALAQCYSTRGIAVVAGYNICSTVSNVFMIAYSSLGCAVGIIVGKYLGAKEFERAVDEDRKLITFSVMISIVIGAIMFALAGVIPQIYNTTEEVRGIARDLLRVYACLMPLFAFQNACYFTLRSGGKTIITFIYDCGIVCLVNFPLAFVLAHFTTLPILWMYIIVNSVDIIKTIFGYVLLKKRIWLNRLV